MNLRFVEAFYWAATLKSVTRAAEKLFVTQSALSSRIAALEAEFGCLLLDRRGRQLRLTAAGVRFLNHAQRLLSLEGDIKSEMGAEVSRATVLRVGAIESVLHSWLIDWVQQLRGSHPELELELTVETTPVLTEQLRRGTIDLGFAALPVAADGVRTRALAPMPMAFVGHRERHRARRYSMQALAQFDLLTFQRGSQPHVALLDVMRAAGLESRRVHTISSISAMVQLVETGFGIATLPQAAAARLAQRLPLRPLPCDVQLPPLPIHASYRDDPTDARVRRLVDGALRFGEGFASHRQNR